MDEPITTATAITHAAFFAPELNGYVGLRYDAPGGWYAQAQLVGSGKVYRDAANRYSRNGYGLANLLAGYRSGDWELAGYVNNPISLRYPLLNSRNPKNRVEEATETAVLAYATEQPAHG